LVLESFSDYYGFTISHGWVEMNLQPGCCACCGTFLLNFLLRSRIFRNRPTTTRTFSASLLLFVLISTVTTSRLVLEWVPAHFESEFVSFLAVSGAVPHSHNQGGSPTGNVLEKDLSIMMLIICAGAALDSSFSSQRSKTPNKTSVQLNVQL
jgi:hypothetical protein